MHGYREATLGQRRAPIADRLIGIAQGKKIMPHTKLCSKCQTVKTLDNFYFHKTGRDAGAPFSACIECERLHRIETREYRRAWLMEYRHSTGTQRPMSLAKDSGVYLGIVIGERILANYFNDITRMPYGNPGYDFICKRGYKIEVKSACLRIDKRGGQGWQFKIKRNQIADYFLILAFDDRENLEPQHVWLIPGDKLRHLGHLSIADSYMGLSKWIFFERPIGKIVAACDALRDKASC